MGETFLHKVGEFFAGLTKGQVRLHRDWLLTGLPGIATFLWFGSLLLFAAFCFTTFDAQYSDEAAKGLALITAVHLGTLVTLYLSTLSENANPELNDDKKFPFVLSLQGLFVESLALAGALIYVIGKALIFEKARITEAAEKTESAKKAAEEAAKNATDAAHAASQVAHHLPFDDMPLLRQIISRLPGVEKGLLSPDHQFIVVAILLLICVLLVAHLGFSLVKRDREAVNLISATSESGAQPPITSASLRTQISALLDMQKRLREKASDHTRSDQKYSDRLQTIAQDISMLSAEIAERQEELNRLESERSEFGDTVSKAEDDIRRAMAISETAERSLSLRLYRRILSYLRSGLASLLLIGDAFADQIQRFKDEIEARQTSIQRLTDERQRIVDLRGGLESESASLSAEATALQSRLDALNELSGQIDAEFGDWNKPQTLNLPIGADTITVKKAILPGIYKRAVTFSYKGGILLLFVLAVAFGVIEDFLLDLKTDAATEPGRTPIGIWIGFLAIIVLARLIYPAGIIGSWRAIANSGEDAAGETHRAPPSFMDTLKVMASNAIGFVVFAALVIGIGIYYNAFIKWPADYKTQNNLHDFLGALYNYSGPYFILIFVYIAAFFLIIFAPLWMYVWERYFRASRGPGDRIRRMLDGLMWGVLSVISLGALIFAAYELSQFHPKPPPPSEEVEVVKYVPEKLTQLSCPVDLLETTDGLKVSAWKLGKTNELSLDLNLPKCTINVGAPPQVNYVVIVGAASSSGSIETNSKLAQNRINSVCSLLKSNEDVKSGAITLYQWNWGRYEPNAKAKAGDAADQRPLIIVSGNATGGVTSDVIKDKLTPSLVMEDDKSDSKKSHPKNYPHAGDLQLVDQATCQMTPVAPPK